jgi:hypothetical protein
MHTSPLKGKQINRRVPKINSKKSGPLHCTISKDSTAGPKARQDHLFVEFAKRSTPSITLARRNRVSRKRGNSGNQVQTPHYNWNIGKRNAYVDFEGYNRDSKEDDISAKGSPSHTERPPMDVSPFSQQQIPNKRGQSEPGADFSDDVGLDINLDIFDDIWQPFGPNEVGHL